MPQVNISQISIDFPYTPYECQVEYMEKVIECLENKQNGLLESPTGTGKTLCLLCATLGWLESYKSKLSLNCKVNGSNVPDINYLFGSNSTPKIIYASRTHSQLTQVLKELKKTKYANQIKSTILASRDQLCIHPQVSKEKNNTIKIQKCRGKITHRTCHYYNNVNEYFTANKIPSANGSNPYKNALKPRIDLTSAILPMVPDIEELVSFGQAYSICPYYSARELTKMADLILMPYNYLVDTKNQILASNGLTRGSNKANAKILDSGSAALLQGAILIFDEAHNLERFCEDAASIELTSTEIAQAICEIDLVIENLLQRQPNTTEISCNGSKRGPANAKKSVYCSNDLSTTNSSTLDPSIPDLDDFQDLTIEELARLKEIFCNLEAAIDAFEIANPKLYSTNNYNSTSNFDNNNNGTVLTLSYIFGELILRRFKITCLQDARSLVNLLDRLLTCIIHIRDSSAGARSDWSLDSSQAKGKNSLKVGFTSKIKGKDNASTSNVSGLEKFCALIKTLFGVSSTDYLEDIDTKFDIKKLDYNSCFAPSDPLSTTKSKGARIAVKNDLRSVMAKKYALPIANTSACDRWKPKNNSLASRKLGGTGADELTLFKELVQDNMRNFRLHLRDDTQVQSVQNKLKSRGWSINEGQKLKPSSRILSLWCFSPSHTIKELFKNGIRCMILTSGTLSPINTFAQIMNVPFVVRLENNHIINDDQVLITSLARGPDNITPLNSAYRNRKCEKYMTSLGLTILNLSRIITRGGILVFFPSYSQLTNCIDYWKTANRQIWSSIERLKPIFTEPKSKDELHTQITSYYETIDKGSGYGNDQASSAILMAVCRGKLSEGYDFADRYARAVLIFGIPYPARQDPKISLKIQFMNERYTAALSEQKCSSTIDDKDALLNGESWYRLEADRAVNQAVGRVIRHKMDYGAIVLCDERFHVPNQTQNTRLSKWLRPRLRHSLSFGALIGDLKRFFTAAYVNYPLSNCQSFLNNGIGDDMIDGSSTARRKKKLKKLQQEGTLKMDLLESYKNSRLLGNDDQPYIDTQLDRYYDANSQLLSQQNLILSSCVENNVDTKSTAEIAADFLEYYTAPPALSHSSTSIETSNKQRNTSDIIEKIRESNELDCSKSLIDILNQSASTSCGTNLIYDSNKSCDDNPLIKSIATNIFASKSKVLDEINTLNEKENIINSNFCTVINSENGNASSQETSIICNYNKSISTIPFKATTHIKPSPLPSAPVKVFKSLEHFLYSLKKSFRKDLEKYYAFCEDLKHYNRTGNIQKFVERINFVFDYNPEYASFVNHLKRYIKECDLQVFESKCLVTYVPFKENSKTAIIFAENNKFEGKGNLTKNNNSNAFEMLNYNKNLNHNAKKRISSINANLNVTASTINNHMVAPDLLNKTAFYQKLNERAEKMATKKKVDQSQPSILSHFGCSSTHANFQ